MWPTLRRDPSCTTAKAQRMAGPSIIPRRPRPRIAGSQGRSGVAGLALGGGEDAGAVLVRPLIGADPLGPCVVALGQDRLDLGGGELVVAGPRLVAAQRGDAAEDGRAVLVLALVGVDL